jgi:hypothetical protein
MYIVIIKGTFCEDHRTVDDLYQRAPVLSLQHLNYNMSVFYLPHKTCAFWTFTCAVYF